MILKALNITGLNCRQPRRGPFYEFAFFGASSDRLVTIRSGSDNLTWIFKLRSFKYITPFGQWAVALGGGHGARGQFLCSVSSSS